MAVRKVTLADGSVRWRVRVYAGTDEAGRQTVISETYEKKREADAAERRLKNMKGMGALTAPSRETLAAFLKRWLDDIKEPALHPKTLHSYRQMMSRYIDSPPAGCPPIGKIRLKALQVGAFTALYAFMRKELNLSPRTIQLTHTILRQAMKYAVAVGAVPKNPTDGAVVPTRKADDAAVENGEVQAAVDESEEKNVKSMTREQTMAFLKEAGADRYAALWRTMLYSGIRPGEAYGLKWDDVSLEDGRIHVRRTLVRVGLKKGESWRLMPPKTKKARRVIEIPATTVAALKSWKTAQKRERVKAGAEYQHHDFAFTTPYGLPLQDGYMARHVFKPILQRAGLGDWEQKGDRKVFRPWFTPYSLRHTHATMLMAAGTNPKVVSARLGHSSVIITLDIYSHVMPGLDEGAAGKLEALLAQG